MGVRELAVLSLLSVLVVVDPALAEDAGGGSLPLGQLGAALGVAIAALGGALGQSKIMGAALEGIGRNPGAAGQMFLPWLLGVAFVESLVIFTWVISASLIGLI